MFNDIQTTEGRMKRVTKQRHTIFEVVLSITLVIAVIGMIEYAALYHFL